MTEKVGIYFSKNTLAKRLQSMYDRAEDPTPAMQQAADAMRESVREEFAGGFFKAPTGGIQRWKPRKAFGDKPNSHPLLIHTGELMAAWTNPASPHAVTRVTKKTAAIGITGDERFLAIAETHRGGLGKRPSAGRVTTVKALEASANADRYASTDPRFWAMYWYLRKNFNVRVGYRKLRTEGFKIPARPHGAMNPKLALEIKAIMRDWLSGQKKRGRKR